MNSESYYVFRASGGEMPRCAHDTLEEAMVEARRLAKKEGRQNIFHVVKCVATVRANLEITEQVHLEKSQNAEQIAARLAGEPSLLTKIHDRLVTDIVDPEEFSGSPLLDMYRR